jgi:hypothetical protein
VVLENTCQNAFIVSNTTTEKSHIVNTTSNQQNKQNGRNSLGLPLLVRNASAMTPNLLPKSRNAQRWPQAVVAPFAGLKPVLPLCHRHYSDWTQLIRGANAPCRSG